MSDGGALVPATIKVHALAAPPAVYSAGTDGVYRITIQNDGEHPYEFDNGDELFEAQILKPGDMTVPSEATAAMVSMLDPDDQALLASFAGFASSAGAQRDRTDASRSQARNGRP